MNAIGIDLGTSNSVVSVYDRGLCRTLHIYGHPTTPSVVSWDPKTGERYVGHAAKKRVLIYPETSIVSNKRFMGDREKRYEVLGKSYTPVDVAAIILKYLADGASETLGRPVSHAVVTVPAYFDGKQKEDTQQAARQAGLNVLQLQAEPTAAAIAYGLNQGKDQRIIVYDLGGGTFDVSVLEVKDNRFSVKAVGGDTMLGGDDFDRAIMDLLYDQIRRDFNLDLRSDAKKPARLARQKLKELAEQAKMELTGSRQCQIEYPRLMGRGNFEYVLKRSALKQLITPYLTRTLKILRDTLRDSGFSPDDINRIICVGGSTKSPLVQEVITEELRAPFMAQNVDEIVAHGAAITAASRFLPIELEPTNVTPFDLGIRLDNDRFGILIPKNTPIPATLKDVFTTHTDWATETEVVVFQGQNELCSNNSQLGGFLLRGIQEAEAGVPRIEVAFSIDESDILTVNAFDLSTKAAGNLEVVRFTPKPYEPPSPRPLDVLRIGVSRVGCDDMGAVLSKLGFRWTLLKDEDLALYDKLKLLDLVFINCSVGLSTSTDAAALNRFVSEGGVLYISDLSAPIIEGAFPGKLSFGMGGHAPQTVSASVTNDEVRRALRKDTVNIYFDLPFWVPIQSVSRDVEVFLRAKVALYSAEDFDALLGSGTASPSAQRVERTLMAGFNYGKGYVVYTAFHNHAQPSEEEMQLLKVIALKPVSVSSQTSLVELVQERT